MSTLPLTLFVLFLSPSLFPSSSAHRKKAHIVTHRLPPAAAGFNLKRSFNKVYAFGDSSTDTGNAYLLGGFKGPLVSSFPAGPNAAASLQKGRLCDGRLVVDFLSQALSIPYLPPYKNSSANFSSGVNFAVAGSTCLPAKFFVNKKLFTRSLIWRAMAPQSFQIQIDWYNKYLQDAACRGKDGASCKAEMENALFWVGDMGVNDYARTFGTSVSAHWLTRNSVASVSKLLEALMEKGARYMVVQGLPPIGCLPVSMLLSPSPGHSDRLGCAAEINSVILMHNVLLQRKLSELQKRVPDATIAYADYWNAYRAILTNATSKYHFKEPFKACCGAGEGKLNFDANALCGAAGTNACRDPSKHMIWDGLHLTETMHHHLADLFFNQGFCKPSFAEMIRRKKPMH